MIEKFIKDLEELKKVNIKNFKLPMVGSTNYDIDEILNLLKKIK